MPVHALAIQVGTTANKIIQVYLPAVHLEVPSLAEADGVSQLTIPFEVVKGSSTADSSVMKVTYK